MKLVHRDNYKLEYLLYGGIWIAVLLYPLIGVVQNTFDSKSIEWVGIGHTYISILPFLILFFVNAALLLPYVLLKGHVKTYTVLALLLLGFFVAYKFSTLPEKKPEQIKGEQMTTYRMPPPPKPPHYMVSPIPGPVITDTIIAILLLGMGVGINAIFNQFRQQKRIAELEKEQMQEKLAYLKAQISPHFFLNVLNNIHGLIEINPPRAQQLILEMSGLMRYVLYESTATEVSLKKELEFVNTYLSLMRGRYSSKKVKIEVTFPDFDKSKDVTIPPLLFIVFIENAFKYGISYRTQSFIQISFQLTDGRLIFQCINSLHSESEQRNTSKGGLGLKNVKKRLTMLYGDDFTLTINHISTTFNVELNIPVYENKMHRN